MNESLAKQLHVLLLAGKLQYAAETNRIFKELEDGIKEIIEENQNQEKPRKTKQQHLGKYE